MAQQQQQQIKTVSEQAAAIHLVDPENHPIPQKSEQNGAGRGGSKSSLGRGLGLRSRRTAAATVAGGNSNPGHTENRQQKEASPTTAKQSKSVPSSKDKENVQLESAKPKSAAPFQVFQDETGQSSGGLDSTSSSPHSPQEKHRKIITNDVSADSGFGRTVEGQGCHVPEVLGAVPFGPWQRRPLQSLPIDALLPSVGDDEVIKSSSGLFGGYSPDEGLKDMSFDDKEEGEDGESVYESAASSSETTYHTAPAPSEKEAHLDLIYCVPDYTDDIYVYLRHKEVQGKLRPKLSYIRRQSQVSRQMRGILLDWLVEVALEYNMREDTLHLGINLVDRFLSSMDIPKEKLQLVGTTAMMVAAKYEEIYPPELAEFVYITDDTYTKKQVLKMERVILSTLDFEIASPTALTFAPKYLKLCRADQRTTHMTMYLCDLSLLDYDMLRWCPSQVAGAAVCLANLVTNCEPWPIDLQVLTERTVIDLYDCLKDLLKNLQNVRGFSGKAVYEKYKDVKFSQVALIEPLDCLPEIED